MKRILFYIGLFLTISLTTVAQSPNNMSYQAVVRDANDQLVTNASVGMQFSILQGSSTGTDVYVEAHTVSTNANGLVSLEIGGGTVVSGDLNTIDWSAGPYYLKMEIDPTGGSNYTISATSAMNTVPYATHAGSAALAINARHAEVADTAFYVASTDHATQASTSDHAVYADSLAPRYHVGDFAHGGVVFWVDETGQHGLVCAKEEQTTAAGERWFAGTAGSTQAKGNGIGAGKMNTAIIIAASVAIGDDGNTYAARLCNEYEVTENGVTYGDWYLPSIAELHIMYLNKAIINATALANGGVAFSVSGNYWSSTEDNANNAYREYFWAGGQPSFAKNAVSWVRAIRTF